MLARIIECLSVRFSRNEKMALVRLIDFDAMRGVKTVRNRSIGTMGFMSSSEQSSDVHQFSVLQRRRTDTLSAKCSVMTEIRGKEESIVTLQRS